MWPFEVSAKSYGSGVPCPALRFSPCRRVSLVGANNSVPGAICFRGCLGGCFQLLGVNRETWEEHSLRASGVRPCGRKRGAGGAFFDSGPGH